MRTTLAAPASAIAVLMIAGLALFGCGPGEAASSRTAELDEDGTPRMPRLAWHLSGMNKSEAYCSRCHASGLNGAPVMRHEGIQEKIEGVRCQTCHELVPE